MIYYNDLKHLLVLVSILNTCVIAIGAQLHISSFIIFCVFFIEIIYIYFEVKRRKNILWLKEHGITKHLSVEDIICTSKIIGTKSGDINIDITIQTKDSYSDGHYKGFISIPHSCFPSFQESLSEIGIEIKIDPNNVENYYICLEKVAEHRWIPNSCKFVPESKYQIWFWILINIIIMSGVFLI